MGANSGRLLGAVGAVEKSEGTIAIGDFLLVRSDGELNLVAVVQRKGERRKEATVSGSIIRDKREREREGTNFFSRRVRRAISASSRAFFRAR